MARHAKPAARRVLKMADWPALDQRLWREGTRSTLSVLDAPYAHTLRPTTLRNAARGRLGLSGHHACPPAIRGARVVPCRCGLNAARAWPLV